ncbi:MAG: hypothetical protein K8H88_03315 [Sandaracinaceae bacterium]|nr:hypothetical protein [Sandaracinaceae bacterium]
MIRLNRNFVFALALGSIGLLSACGGDDSGQASAQAAGGGGGSAEIGSCNKIEALSSCTDLSGDAFALGEEMQRSLCEGMTGTYAASTCPTANLVGSCNIGAGQIRRYYSTGTLAFTAQSAQEDCTGLYEGTWTAAN